MTSNRRIVESLYQAFLPTAKKNKTKGTPDHRLIKHSDEAQVNKMTKNYDIQGKQPCQLDNTTHKILITII